MGTSCQKAASARGQIRRFASTGICRRVAATTSGSMSTTRRPGSAPKPGQQGSVGADDPTVTDAGRSRTGPRRAHGGRVGLGRRGQIAGAVQRAGAEEQLPLLELARSRTPGGRHADQLRAAFGQSGEQAREAEVVAGGEADAELADSNDQQLSTRSHRLGLGEAEGVEQVHLVVVLVDPAPDDPQRVGDPPAVGGGEHSRDHDDSVPVGDLDQALRPGPVQWFGHLNQRPAEAAHGRLRKDHQFGTVSGSG